MNEEKRYCPECQVGLIQRKKGTYYTWIENEMVIVPDFPCWVCDVCGHRDWDQGAVFNLGMILSPAAGTPVFDRIANIPSGANSEKDKSIRKSKAHRSAL